MLAFATDLHDEGLDVVLGNIQERAGVDGLTLAVAYHDARDLFPHNPAHKVRYLEGGAIFFSPDETRYEGLRLRPRVSELARSGDPLGELCEVAGNRGMRVNAWTVFLHNDRLGFAHPRVAVRLQYVRRLQPALKMGLSTPTRRCERRLQEVPCKARRSLSSAAMTKTVPAGEIQEQGVVKVTPDSRAISTARGVGGSISKETGASVKEGKNSRTSASEGWPRLCCWFSELQTREGVTPVHEAFRYAVVAPSTAMCTDH